MQHFFLPSLMAVLLFISGPACAQENFIAVRYFVKKDSVMIRWAPSSPELFRTASEKGYKIVRTDLRNGDKKIISDEKILPLSKDNPQWAGLIKSNNNAALLNELLFLPDNFGGNMSSQQKQTYLNTIFGFVLFSCDQDAELAKTAGLFFTDVAFEKNATYTYSVELSDNSDGFAYKKGEVSVNTSVLSQNPSIDNLKGIFKNKTAKLKWDVAGFNESYGAYNLERSTDNKNFRKINRAPLAFTYTQYDEGKTEITYIDTMPESNIKYYYRIHGINFFGEQSDASNIVTGTAYNEMLSFPVIESLQVIKNNSVFIRWKLGDPAESAFVEKYLLLRAPADKGPYEVLFSSADKKSFTDSSPLPSNYYKIAAVSKGNDTLTSFSYLALIIDTIPPEKIMGLTAVADTNGIVKLQWKAAPEADFQGYKIFRANSLTEEFVQINKHFVTEPWCYDTLNLHTLSRYSYYAVAATDQNFNNSPYSDPVKVKRPDTIPPVPAVITTLSIKNNGVFAKWIPGSSDDVAKTSLLRRTESPAANPDTVFVFYPTAPATEFTDSAAIPGKGYYYSVVVTDSSLNSSESEKMYLMFESGFRPKITGIEARADRVKHLVVLSWKYSDAGVDHFLIYRSGAGSKMTSVASVPADEFTYSDPNLFMGNSYEYRIKAVYKSGVQSIISDPVNVEY